MIALNDDIAGRLDEVARLLREQGAGRFRVQAYERAAETLRGLGQPVREIWEREGLEGLERLPGVGESIGRAIRDLLQHGRLGMLERLRGDHDAVTLLRSVPGVGIQLAWKLHDELGLESLEDLEAAAHDGRLAEVEGLGEKRLAGIRDSLAHRLGAIRRMDAEDRPPAGPSVGELLDVDREYRQAAAAGKLKRIAPRRFNPNREAWLPVLHTMRDGRHYTALFSNTAHAHRLHRTRDWVVIYYEDGRAERIATVITAEFGRLEGMRIVRGREAECERYYRELGLLPAVERRG